MIHQTRLSVVVVALGTFPKQELLVARVIRDAIHANRLVRIIRNWNPNFYSASGRFARITRISDSRESPDARLWEANLLGEPRAGLCPSDGDPPELWKLWVPKSPFLEGATRKMGILGPKAPFAGMKWEFFFLPRDHLFPVWGFLTPVGGGRIRNFKIAYLKLC